LNPQPKKKRVESKDYLSFIRKNACSICASFPVDADHLKTRGSGGSDFDAVPLCRTHHMERHRRGLRMFQIKYQVDLWQRADELRKRFNEH
jgi:hypothetical protein